MSKKVIVSFEIKPEMAILMSMILHGGTYGIATASKLFTAKSIKDMHDIGTSIISQVEEQEDLEEYENEMLSQLSPDEQAFYKELKRATGR